MAQHGTDPRQILVGLAKKHDIDLDVGAENYEEEMDKLIEEYVPTLNDAELGEVIGEGDVRAGDVYSFIGLMVEGTGIDLTEGRLGPNASWRSLMERMAVFVISSSAQ